MSITCRRLVHRVAMALAAGAALAASSLASAETIEVDVRDNTFMPKHVTIKPGDTVRWVWSGFILHSTTSAAGIGEQWDSGLERTPFEFEYTFDNVGVFTYYCTLHGSDLGNGNVTGMAGSVVVADDCLTLSVDQLVAGEATTFTISGGTPGERVALVYGFDRGRTAINGFADFCATFGISGVKQNRQVGSLKKLEPDATIRQFLPANTKGLSVSFQAAMRGTCPDICMSNIIDATIE